MKLDVPKLPKKEGERKTERMYRLKRSEIFGSFEDGKGATDMSRAYKVSRQTAFKWKREWLAARDFLEAEPDLIREMKMDAMRVVKAKKILPAQVILDSKPMTNDHRDKLAKAQANTAIDKMRSKGLTIIHLAMDRIELLIDKEKNIKSLAAIISAVAPYVATRKDIGSEMEKPMSERRVEYIQNVMNIYNNKLEQHDKPIEDKGNTADETFEDHELEWTGPEPTTGEY